MAIDRQDSPYRRGNRYDRLPIPMVQEHCIPVDAGAVQLVIESRRLTNAIVEETYQGEIAGGIPFDDGGATLHVLGTGDGLEHLRFDSSRRRAAHPSSCATSRRTTTRCGA